MAGVPGAGVRRPGTEEDLYALADERTVWRRETLLRFPPAYREGRLVTLEPVVRATAFAAAYGSCRAVDGVFHAVTGATHVSAPVAALAGTMAALSTGTTAVVRTLDISVVPRIAPVADAGYRLWHSPLMAPVRGQLPGLRGDLKRLSLMLASGPGRFVAGFASVVAVAAVASLFSPVPALLVVAVATVSGAARWAFPHVDERYGIVERFETAGRAIRRATSRMRAVTGARAAPRDRPSVCEPPPSLEDPCPFVAGDRLRYRHLSVREALRLTERIAGPRPARSHTDDVLWMSLAVTLKKTVRGGGGTLWVLAGEGAPEKLADVLAALAVRSVARGGSVPRFDLSPFGAHIPGAPLAAGRATRYYTASAIRRAVGDGFPHGIEGVPAMPGPRPPESRAAACPADRLRVQAGAVLAVAALGVLAAAPANRRAALVVLRRLPALGVAARSAPGCLSRTPAVVRARRVVTSATVGVPAFRLTRQMGATSVVSAAR